MKSQHSAAGMAAATEVKAASRSRLCLRILDKLRLKRATKWQTYPQLNSYDNPSKSQSTG
jgi:hypothetical protein